MAITCFCLATFSRPILRDSELRLYLVDHSGWFVSDRYASGTEELAKGLGAEKKQLQDLLRGLDASLILENGAQEIQVCIGMSAICGRGRYHLRL